LHEYELLLLNLLKKQKSATVDSLEDSLKINKDSIVWAAENLAEKGFASVERDRRKSAKISDEGKKYISKFPEELLVESIEKKGGTEQLKEIKDSIGLIWAKKNGWIELSQGNAKITPKGKGIALGNSSYNYRKVLSELSKGLADPNSIIEQNAEIITELRKRNLIEIIERGEIKSIAITKAGAEQKLEEEKGIGQLTRDAIISGKWKREEFRKYDINSPTEETYPARLHPLHEFLDTIRRIWLNMGFTEVSGPIIESAFWNFDALFSPQDHPTRDMQDTFFLKNPSELNVDDIALMKRVKKMHKTGWQDKWREDVAKQAVLRTHTTNVSAHSINKYANLEEVRYPLKLFSIGRTFRNESIDYKHLAEFYMVDGIIIGNNLTLANLIYTLKQFYAQLGIENLIFRPAYFPFVEPGLEIYYHDKKRNDSIELGGAGIIRKEITKAMGTNKTVLAWGPGLDRLMLNSSLGIDSISELYKNDIGWLRRRKDLKILG
jgi:phenylalanyl-tRNA synthetase alpha chain